MTAVTEVMALAVVAGVVVLLARFLGNYLHFRKLELAIPGPPSLFLLGNALDMVSATEDTTMKTFLRLIGGRREMCRFTVLNQLIVAVQDPEQIDEVVRCKKFDDKPSFFYSFLKVGAEKGLVQLNGLEWKAHRKWLEPGFHVQVLNRSEHIFREEAQAYVDRVEVDKEVDVVENLRKASVRNFLRTSMEDSAEYEDVGMECTGFLEMFLHSVSSRTFNPILWSDRVFKMTPLGKKVVKTVQATRNISATFIAKKRAEIEKHQNDCDFDRARKTLMDIMLDPNTVSQAIFEEDAITDELITFFGANVETTVSTLTWTLKVLSLLPEVQERVYAELMSVVGDSDVSIEHLPKLEYLNRVIKESMRMFPTIPFVARQCYKETKVCGHTIPAGAVVLINMFGAHYDPKHWDKPEVFDPDRFLPERSKDRHPCAYMPFSAGPRKCIGWRYAMMNMTIFLATLMRAFILLPTDDHKDLKSLANNMTFDLASHLVGGTRVKFHRRRGKAA